jgi:hypothetical protein
MADESDTPPETSVCISSTARLSGAEVVCSSRMASDRSSDMPEFAMVANCRAKIARSLPLTRLPIPGIFSSMFRPWPAALSPSGTSPRCCSMWVAAASFAASTVPFDLRPVASMLL